ncbi:DUF559 domain-containing protein [Sphingomonas sp. I4]
MRGFDRKRGPFPTPPACGRGACFASARGLRSAAAHPSRKREGTEGGPRPFCEDRPTQKARELRLNPTDAERRLWRALSRRQIAGVRFNRQVPVGPYIADFAARSKSLSSKLTVASTMNAPPMMQPAPAIWRHTAAG